MNKQTQKLKLKLRQKEIQHLLYRFRFINRIQIQTLLNHKHSSRIQTWLNELTEYGYIRQFYDKKFAPVSSAVYSLGLNGRKFFKNNKKYPDIKPELLDRVWQEHTYTLQFRNHCVFLVDIYLSLVTLTEKGKAKLNFYTQTDLYGMEYMILDNPDSYFSIEEPTGDIKRYFLDIFDDIKPSVHRKRIRQYFYYYKESYWQDHTKKPFPQILLICPNDKSKNHLYYYIQKKLNDAPELLFYLSTWEKIKTLGICRESLQKVEVIE